MDDRKPTRVIGWTNWFNDKYPDAPDEDWQINDRIVAEALRSNGYHWDGYTHQNANFGTPVLDNGTKVTYSYRAWGGVMVEAYPNEIDDSDRMGYCDWAWAPCPENSSLEKFPPESEWL